jgi:hypothetical protein
MAIFDGEDLRLNTLLSQFLLPSTLFVSILLYDISKVDRGFDSNFPFKHQVGYVKLFKDRITIEPYDQVPETEASPIEIPIEKVKLLLFEWGVALQRWRMKQKKL